MATSQQRGRLGDRMQVTLSDYRDTSGRIGASKKLGRREAFAKWRFRGEGAYRIGQAELRLRRRVLPQPRLRRGEPCNRHAERRARHIFEAEQMAERDRRRIAAVLAADSDLEFGARLAPTLDADTHQFADALAVDRHERIGLQDAARGVGTKEACGIVTADTEAGLRQVVGAE